jgi:uncharacterized membrane protein YfcA
MDLHHALFLLAAGLAGGVISAMIGGAAIVTYPALLATGLSPVFATAANIVALTPAMFIAAVSDRSQLPKLDRGFAGLVFASVTGAAVGAVLLLVTPQRVFAALVPLLLGSATILFAFSEKATAWLSARMATRGENDARRWTHSIGVLLPVSVYGGYFGAGVGVLLLGVLSVGTGGDYRSANVTKNLVNSLNCLVASALFVAQGAVTWRPALIMMAGAVIGGLAGSHLARIARRDVMRVAVVVIGALLTVVFAWRYWF